MPDLILFSLAAVHAVPTAFGLEPTGFVALAMLAVFALMLWKRVPTVIGKALDAKIDAIRKKLAEAEELRKEAEALKAEYEAKAKSADKDAAAIIARAEADAKAIVATAKSDTEALVKRRRKMAEEKIAAEERAAIAELQAVAANAASAAAGKLIADKIDEKTDQSLVDEAISKI